MFLGSVKGTGYPLHSPVSPSLPLPYVTVCHHVSTGLYNSDIFTTILLQNTRFKGEEGQPFTGQPDSQCFVKTCTENYFQSKSEIYVAFDGSLLRKTKFYG